MIVQMKTTGGEAHGLINEVARILDSDRGFVVDRVDEQRLHIVIGGGTEQDLRQKVETVLTAYDVAWPTHVGLEEG